MFKFSTETIINSNVDSSGVARFEGSAKELSIKRLGKFLKENIKVIYHTSQKDSTKSKVTVDLSGLTTGDVYRVKVYIRLSGSNNSYFSNDFVFKGKPFVFEFIAGTGNATKVANLVKKYKITDNDYQLLNVTAQTADILALEGSDQYMVLSQVDLEHYVAQTDTTAGEFVKIDEIGGTKVTVVTTASEGVGNPEQLIKNNRLPTAANTRWTHLNPDEEINKAGKYDQYVIYYIVDRGIMGSNVVGQSVTSITQHTLWVEHSAKAAFDAALTAVGAKYVDTAGDSDVINEEGDLGGSGGTEDDSVA